MRESLQKLLEGKRRSTSCSQRTFPSSSALELKNASMNQYLTALQNSAWLKHIRAIIDAATFIARVRRENEINRAEILL